MVEGETLLRYWRRRGGAEIAGGWGSSMAQDAHRLSVAPRDISRPLAAPPRPAVASSMPPSRRLHLSGAISNDLNIVHPDGELPPPA